MAFITFRSGVTAMLARFASSPLIINANAAEGYGCFVLFIVCVLERLVPPRLAREALLSLEVRRLFWLVEGIIFKFA